MDMGGQEDSVSAGRGKPKCAGTVMVIALPEAPDVPVQISFPLLMFLSKEAACCMDKTERQRRNRGTGVGSDSSKANEQMKGKERNYFPPTHVYCRRNVPLPWLCIFTKPRI